MRGDKVRLYWCADDCTIERMQEAGLDTVGVSCCEDCPYAVCDTLEEGYDFPSKEQLDAMK